MTCRDFADFLMEYLDGSLPSPARERFEEHLAECPDCVAYLATYQETVKLGKAACAQEDEALPAEVPNELVQAILAARSGVTNPAQKASKNTKKPRRNNG